MKYGLVAISRNTFVLYLYRSLGAAIAIAIMEWLASMIEEPSSHIPFVTSIILVMALPDAAPSRPKAIIGGHLMSAVAGWLVIADLHAGEASAAVAVGLATVAMLASDTLHPPAGINAFLVASIGLSWRWIASPVLAGVILLAAYSMLWAQGETWIKSRM
jgi:CBS-domain-containing membrane protein